MTSYTLIHRAVEPGKLSGKTRKLVDAALAAGRCVLEPKYDGCNAVLDVPMHMEQNIRAYVMQSRTGEQVKSTLHIIGEAANNRLPPGRYFGEVWHPSWKHSKISGAFRRHDQEPELVFMVFDYIDAREVEAGGSTLPLAERRTRLVGLLGGLRGPIRLAWQHGELAKGTLDSLLDATPTMLAVLRADGGAYDGLMLKQLDLGLKLGSSGSDGATIKLKPRATADLLVVGTFAGKGKYEGMMGGLILALDGRKDSVRLVEVGSGFSDEERQRCIVSDPWLHKIVEVEYLELTEKGMLREPSYKGVRFDKNHGEADNLLES